MLFASTAAAAERSTVMIGDHPTFGRVLIKLDKPGPVTLKQGKRDVTVVLPDDTEVGTPGLVPRNVLRFEGGRGAAKFAIAPGAKIKTHQEGTLLVIDVLDPPSRRRDAASAAATRPNPATAPAPAVQARNNGKPAPPAAHAEPPAPQSAPEQRTADPSVRKPDAETNPTTPAAATAAAAEESTPQGPSRQVRVAAGPSVGAAAFRRGDLGIVVFDDKVTLDRIDDGEGTPWASAQDVQNGTMLTMPLAENESLSLRRDAEGWTIKPGAPSGSPAVQTAVKDGIQFQLGQPGRTLTVSDPVTGQTLLLGTSRQGRGEHNMNDARRSAPGYILLPTWLGLALEATADAVDLRPSLSGYTLALADQNAPGSAVAPVRENDLGIPNASTDTLVRQLNAQIASAASAPPRSRGADRVTAARTMLALGMAAEAQALLGLAASDDPVVARDPAVGALAGVAAVLANRPAEASGLDNPALPTGGDIALWRGLRDAEQGASPATLDTAWRELTGYPEAVKQRIGPIVLETAAKHGVAIPEADLDGPTFALARALHKQAAGDVDAALQALDAIANDRDERASVLAAIAATELRLGNGRITPEAAADRLDGDAIRWRGDGQEAVIRLRVAELRTQAKQYRPALEALRQIEQTFPDTKLKVGPMKTAVFKALLADQKLATSPLELVTLAGDFADCIPDGADGERMAGVLADKLAALDLPSRAIPVLQKLVDTSDSEATKAEFALRLAQLQLDAGDPAKAETLLRSLDPTALASDRGDRRTVLLARAIAARGDPAGAAQSLAGVQSTEADEMRADFFAQAHDWPHSLAALQRLAAKTVPDTGNLTEPQQDLVLREATAAVQAGDAETLRRLKQLDSRMQAPRADLFHVLTATAVQGPADLPRAARELALARTLPDRLDALKLR